MPGEEHQVRQLAFISIAEEEREADGHGPPSPLPRFLAAMGQRAVRGGWRTGIARFQIGQLKVAVKVEKIVELPNSEFSVKPEGIIEPRDSERLLP
jgi:hypothetical protein